MARAIRRSDRGQISCFALLCFARFVLMVFDVVGLPTIYLSERRSLK